MLLNSLVPKLSPRYHCKQGNLKELQGVIDLSRQVSGIYFIQYNSAKESKTSKIVLKRE